MSVWDILSHPHGGVSEEDMQMCSSEEGTVLEDLGIGDIELVHKDVGPD